MQIGIQYHKMSLVVCLIKILYNYFGEYTIITFAPLHNYIYASIQVVKQKNQKLEKLLAVSIVSKSSCKVRLCCKKGKQDVSTVFRNLGRNKAATYNPPGFILKDNVRLHIEKQTNIKTDP